MTDNASFRDILREHIEVKGFNNKKLADATGIPERYIESLLEGRDQSLPPAPYVRGYITKLSSVLDFDKETLWRLYQNEARIQRSGQWDKLPNNRFATRTINKKWLMAGLMAIFLIFYLSSNVYKIFRPPIIKVFFPAEENSIWEKPVITLEGEVESANTLTINGVEVYVNKDGKFEKDYSLQPGLNTVEFIVKRFLGKETKVVRQIIYNEPSAATLPAAAAPENPSKKQ